MTDPAAKARELMAAIRYQVHRPEVTTMGRCSCPCGCESSARGSGMCAECIGMELDSLIDGDGGTAYVYACVVQRDAERAVLEALGGGTSKQRAALDELVREAQERGEYGGRE